MNDTLERVPVEVSEITYEIRKVFGVTAEQAEVLQSVCTTADEALVDAFGDSPAALLRQRAHRLRGAAMHGVSVLLEIAAQSGRLEALAFVKEVIDVSRDDHAPAPAPAISRATRKPKRRAQRRR